VVTNLSDLTTYVVTVKTFKDRHLHIRGQAERHNLKLQFIWDYDADTLSTEDFARVDAKKLPPKSISTVLKHLEAQRRLIESGDKFALVLEDDAILFPEFSATLNQILNSETVPLEPFLLFAGGADNKVTDAFLKAKPNDLVKHPLSTAETYIIERSAAEKRLKWCSENRIDKPADHFLTWIDHKLGIAQYWTGVPLATQGSITGQFKTSLDASRAKHSPLFLRFKYHYNCWRRQALPRIFARMSSNKRNEI